MSPKGGLGRGLEALIPGANATGPLDGGPVSISVGEITPNPLQPRMRMNPAELEELAASIREHGIIQPLIVTQNEAGKYELIAGERRWRAAQMAGLQAVPVIIRQATSQQRLELALIENVQRADLTPLETAEAYRQLAEDFSLSHEEIARQVGKSRVAVTNTLRLLKLPQSIQTALAEGEITEGHARALLGLSSAQAQLAALQTILKNNLNVRQTEELVRRLAGEKKPPLTKPAPEPEVVALENRLRERLGTKVSLTRTKSGGTVVIHYYSDEELNHLLDVLLED